MLELEMSKKLIVLLLIGMQLQAKNYEGDDPTITRGPQPSSLSVAARLNSPRYVVVSNGASDISPRVPVRLPGVFNPSVSRLVLMAGYNALGTRL